MAAPRPDEMYQRAIQRLRLRHLRLLVATGQHANIQSAAQELNISQPAATKMIQDAEADFGMRLFDRTNRGAVPTAQGAALIRHAQVILAQMASATQDMADLSGGMAGRVVVGTLLAGAAQLVPHATHRLLETRPQVTIQIVEGTNAVLMPRLRQGEIDLVVGRLPTHRHRAGLQQAKLIEDAIDLVVGPDHPLARRAGITFDNLAPFGWILPPPDTTLRRQIDAVFLSNGLYQPPKVLESVNYLTNRALLLAGDWIGLAPRQVIGQDVASVLLTRLEYDL